MLCKVCLEDISADCMLTNGICVFCHYQIDEWDSNGQLVKKKDAIRVKRKIKKKSASDFCP